MNKNELENLSQEELSDLLSKDIYASDLYYTFDRALELLGDDTLLARASKSQPDEYYAVKIAQKINRDNKQIMSELTSTDYPDAVRVYALSLIHDNNILEKYAKKDNCRAVRLIASYRLGWDAVCKLLNEEPDVLLYDNVLYTAAKLSVFDLIDKLCAEKPDWIKKISPKSLEKLFDCFSKMYYYRNGCERLLIDSIILAYRSGWNSDVIVANGTKTEHCISHYDYCGENGYFRYRHNEYLGRPRLKHLLEEGIYEEYDENDPDYKNYYVAPWSNMNHS